MPIRYPVATPSFAETEYIQGGPFDPKENWGSNPYGPIMPPQVPHTYQGTPYYPSGSGIPGGTPPVDENGNPIRNPSQNPNLPWWMQMFGGGSNTGPPGSTPTWTDYVPGQYDPGWLAANNSPNAQFYGDPDKPSQYGVGGYNQGPFHGPFHGADSSGPGGGAPSGPPPSGGGDATGGNPLFGGPPTGGGPMGDGGGLFGAASDLASGTRTPEEWGLYDYWNQQATNPETADDRGYFGDIESFGSDPLAYEDTLAAGYGQMGQGVSPAAALAAVQEGQATVKRGTRKANDAAARHAAITGNDAAFYGQVGEASRDEAGALGEQARRTQLEIDEENQRRRAAALQGFSNLSGAKTAAKQSSLGMKGNYLTDIRNQRNTGAGGVERFNQSGRDLQQAGLGLTRSLYDDAAGRSAGYLQGAAGSARLPREIYNESGGFNFGGGG